MDHDEYFNGRWGTGTPNYNNRSWQDGNQERLNEINRQQEEQRAVERRRIEASNKAWAEAMKPPPARAVSWPTASPSHHASSGHGPSVSTRVSSAPAFSSGGGGYYAPSFGERLGELILAPFRFAWALLKFLVKAAFVVALLLVALYFVLKGDKKDALPSAPVERPISVARPAVVAPTARLDEAPIAYMARADGAPAAAPDIAPPAQPDDPPAPARDEAPSAPPDEAPAVNAPSFPRIGAEIRSLAQEDFQRLGLQANQSGALVVSVVADSPAADTRLQADDLIVSINFEPVSDGDGLIELIHKQAAGARVPVVFYRGGVKYTEDITPR